MSRFVVHAPFTPTGDQPQAIEKLAANLRAGASRQTLLGVTGSGKTFTASHLIAAAQKPTLVISHNKTLAMQLYQEFKNFFPDNAVHYFVSYYDYYQPEAYIPRTDTYIEKDSKINDLIDSLRHASTASLLTRKDVIIVASVSCIYGLGNPVEYERASLTFALGDPVTPASLAKSLVELQYARNSFDPRHGHFRVRENTTQIYLPSGNEFFSITIEKRRITKITRTPVGVIDAALTHLDSVRIFPAKHFVAPQEKTALAIANIRRELAVRLAELKKTGKILEAERLKQRTTFDLEMLVETGYTNGVENYSRHLDFRGSGTPPSTLIDYFRHAHGDDFLTLIDESHATIPQIRGMYHGDRSRKQTLVDYGFRLPSALDNRPLSIAEFLKKINQVVYISATPGDEELKESGTHVVPQLIRPTGIPDPTLEVRPTKSQMQDVVREVTARAKRNERSLVMALTKRLAEDIAEYLRDAGIKAEYLHSEIKTLDRPEILKKLRTGEHEALVGINLLREGLDLPEVSFIAILDADKEGFLRNETTLLQIIGRAARHPQGTVILYGDTLTGSMRAAIRETNRRRKVQKQYNKARHITPRHIVREIHSSFLQSAAKEEEPQSEVSAAILASLEREMKRAAKAMDFERAASLRDRINIHKRKS